MVPNAPHSRSSTPPLVCDAECQRRHALSVLQSLLGHSNPHTTDRYFRIRSGRQTREHFSVMEYIRDTCPV
jgi:hypothetical protein